MTAAAVERLAASPERFPGALLLSGPGPRALDEAARRLAAILLCPGRDPEGRCDSCRRTFSGLHPDLLRVEPEGLQIRIDRVREALSFGAGRPYEASRRVVVVSQAEKLGPEAANALLKSLEEPGTRHHWILTTDRPESLLSTIRSRCVAASLPNPSTAARAEALRERGFSPEDAADLVQLDDGDASSHEDLERLRALRARIAGALESGLVGRRLPALLMLAELVGARGEETAVRILAGLLADATLLGSGAGDFVRHRTLSGKLGEIASRSTPQALRRAAVGAADAPPDVRRGNRRLHFEALLLALYGEGA